MASSKYNRVPTHERDSPVLSNETDPTNETQAHDAPSPHPPSLALPTSSATSIPSPSESSPPPFYGSGDTQPVDEHNSYPVPSQGYYLPVPASSHAASVSHHNDGVFSNLSAKPSFTPPSAPQLHPTKDPDAKESPPSYDTVALDPAPLYPDNIVFSAALDSDDVVLVEGLPVGSMLTFFLTMMVSMSFQFVGFCLTYLLSMTHAGRCGSKAGFGVSLIQIGLNLHVHSLRYNDGNAPDDADEDYPGFIPPNATPDEIEAILTRTQWISYLLMITGWFLILKSSLDYMKAKRLEALILATPESMIA